jgi:hypothetical protein
VALGCEDPTNSEIFGWRDTEFATGLASSGVSVSVLAFFREFVVPADARGLRVFFSLTSVPVGVPAVLAGSLFFRVFFTGGAGSLVWESLAVTVIVCDPESSPPSS